MGVCWCPGKWKHQDSKCVQTGKESGTTAATTTTTTTRSPTNDSKHKQLCFTFFTIVNETIDPSNNEPEINLNF